DITTVSLLLITFRYSIALIPHINTRIQGQIQIEIFKEITKKSGEKTFLLKLLLSDDSATIRVLIWGMSAIEYLKVISNSDTVVIS
ncbi:unnamed protein product, partial [marine sediment metagenome]